MGAKLEPNGDKMATKIISKVLFAFDKHFRRKMCQQHGNPNRAKIEPKSFQDASRTKAAENAKSVVLSIKIRVFESLGAAWRKKFEKKTVSES